MSEKNLKMQNETLLSLSETAQILKTTKGTLYTMKCKGEIPENCYVKFGRKILFVQSAVMDWVLSGAAAHGGAA